jgi:glycosyltransferase involved in cell wall biosynthesis
VSNGTLQEQRVLIVAEHASVQFGGEAALPFHYFRVLRSRGVPVWMICHSRTKDELSKQFGTNAPIYYIPDTSLHKILFRIGKYLPDRVSYISTGFLSRVASQISQRSLAIKVIKAHKISVVHQPIPVSPKEPSIMAGLGVPVVIGPMNGGMSFPEGFSNRASKIEKLSVSFGRKASWVLSLAMTGKRNASILLVANERTARALPQGSRGVVMTLIENGVDLSLWRLRDKDADAARKLNAGTQIVSFAAMGRMVSLKALDVLIEAFKNAQGSSSAGKGLNLTLIGDGPERENLLRQCRLLGLELVDSTTQEGVFFTGWLPQKECAETLENADVLLMASLHECGGAVVLEAMALSKPVISTAWGGPLDYCNDSTSILIQPKNRPQLVADFSRAINMLSIDHELRKKLGDGGRARIVEEFDWERKVDQIQQIYARAQSKANPPPCPR